MKTNFDFIIVGAGSAGCVLANKLSANGKFSVCILEAGGSNNDWRVRIPLGIVELMRSKTLNWQFNSAPEPSQFGRQIFNPRGKTLGGSSSINAMLYVRGQPADYDHWQALGNIGWGWEDVLPYFKSTEHQERGADNFHGVEGELNIADCRSKLPIFDDFIKAAVNAGFVANNDFNGASQEGVGYYQVTQKDGERFSAADAFLSPILSRSNVTLYCHASVQQLTFEPNQTQLTVNGLQVLINGHLHTLTATKEVILSAGAFNSPQILMLSGIGDASILQQHKIALKHHLPGVGKNLQDHVDALVVTHCKRTDLLAYRPKALWFALKQAWQYWQHKTGLLSSPVAEAGGFVKSSSGVERPDIQLHCIPAAMDDHGRNHAMLMHYGISIHACLLRPNSRGFVSLNSNNPNDDPFIQLNMLSDKQDQQTMIQAVRLVRNILAQPPLQQQVYQEIFPGEQCQSDDDILQFLKQKANTIYHPVGTCKMGVDNLSVVNADLQVHGVNQLRVVDASIMPTLISGNTNAPTIMIAAKIADVILKQHYQC